MMTRPISILPLLLICLNARCQSPDQLAAQFVKLLRYDAQVDAMHEQCVRSQESVTPESLVSRDPNYFDGFTPASSQWTSIVSAFAEYRREICSKPSSSDIMHALAKTYASSMTEEQLRQSIDFYSSSTGQVLIEANRRASEAAGNIYAELNGRYASDLTAQLSKKIRALSSGK